MEQQSLGGFTAVADAFSAPLSGVERAALVVMALDTNLAGKVLRFLNEGEVEQVVAAVASPPSVSIEQRTEVLEECNELLRAQAFVRQGGISQARELLESAYGKDRTEDILHHLGTVVRTRPFESLAQVRPDDLVGFLQSENPQITALVLAYVTSEVAARVLESFPPVKRVDVVRRMARLDTVRREVLRVVESVVSERVSSWVQFDFPVPKGLDAAVAMLVQADRSVERDVLQILGDEDPLLAQEIKSRLFLFDDLIRLRDEMLQKILRQVDKIDLAIALRPYGDEIRARFYQNMSDRASREVREEIEESQPVPVTEIEAAQGRIVAQARAMEDAGEIDLTRGVDKITLI